MNRDTAGLLLALACVCAFAGQGAAAAFDVVFFSDYTGDGTVDASDYALWRSNFGDVNQDNSINASDLADWRANYGSTAGSSQSNFNGSSLGLPVPTDSLFAWQSVPLAAMFDTVAQFDAWRNKFTSAAAVPGDFSGDGIVDAADYTIWRDTLLNNATLDKFLASTGDFNGDGVVDGRDYMVWRDNLGASVNVNTPVGFAPGDFNEDGVVDAADYTVWRDNLRESVSIRPANDWWWIIDPVTIPEPGAITSLALCGVMLLSRRSMRQQLASFRVDHSDQRRSHPLR